MIGAATVVAALAVVAWFTVEYRANKEQAAAQALDQARFVSQSGNLPLAANDLDRIIEQFSGTRSAAEAVILLAQVRLLQEQPHLAAEGLQSAVADLSEQFQAPAYGLLGSALENAGNPADAAVAYENAARTTWYHAVAAQYLNDAGRAWWSAGDAQRAILAYERVLSDYPESRSASEARVRIAELRALAAVPST
jgi:tetratricopeptide (TPR) repeat protein